MMTQPTFWVRDIPVYGDVILSPMAGYSDVPYRAICRAYGSAMNYTEFVAVEMLQSDKPNSFWRLLDRKPDEHPMVFQIFGNDAQKILNAAQRIEQWGPDIIDVNMGCSTRKVSGRGAGVGMMRDPDLVAETFRLLSRHLSVPVTAKMRLGWDELVNYLEIGRILEDNGCALIAIHGRTKEQKYRGRANWDAIGALKETVGVPVIGNGDISDPDEIDAMLAYTGCDAVMVGRGAIGNPWIFARQRREEIPFAQRVAGIRRHLDEMLAYHGKRGLQQFRKHLKRYLDDHPELDDLVSEMMVAPSPALLLDLLDVALTRVEAVEGTAMRVSRLTASATPGLL